MGDHQHQTVRMRGLPPLTTVEDVHTFLVNRNIIAMASQAVIGPICDQAQSPLKQTTVSFSLTRNPLAALLALPRDRRQFTSAARPSNLHERTTTVEVDDDFHEFTTIYSANNPETGNPDIDIIATHGLGGHAWSTFTTWEEVSARQFREINWLRDILPGYLGGYQRRDGQRGIYARIMLFGYNANIWKNAVAAADFNHAVNNMVLGLDRERRQDPTRPLFFVAHSLGGIVAKSAISTAMSHAIANDPQGQVECPIKGCLFFGVPHKGSDVANDFAPILNALGTFFRVGNRNLEALRSQSVILSNIADEFHFIRSDNNIPVISCFELDRDVGRIIVPETSAVLDYGPDTPPRIPIYRSHREIARFRTSTDQGYESVADSLARLAALALPDAAEPDRPQPQPELELPGENPLSGLQRFDTVFLVDDSPSMAGPRWALAQKILQRAAEIATRYDEDGIDIHFLNNQSLDTHTPITTPAQVEQLLRRVTPTGSTPLGTRLQLLLRNYVLKFVEQDRQSQQAHGHGHGHQHHNAVRQLNLVVLTDGKPDERPESIKNTIVRVAKRLDEVWAVDEQIGLQFCVIGNEPGVPEFYSRLDNDLVPEAGLQRDMVDWIHCRNAADLTDGFYTKLLIGSWNKVEDDRDIVDSAPSPPMLQQPAALSHGPALRNATASW